MYRGAWYYTWVYGDCMVMYRGVWCDTWMYGDL